ncbi:hypothetical protein D3C72_2588070 [compost metagenome]
MVLEIGFPVVILVVVSVIVIRISIVVISVGSVIDFASFQRFQSGEIQFVI